MPKKPLKKSSAVFFISLHVSTKVRYVAATAAPASLLNPPKFFLRFVNERTALSQQLLSISTLPMFTYPYRYRLVLAGLDHFLLCPVEEEVLKFNLI